MRAILAFLGLCLVGNSALGQGYCAELQRLAAENRGLMRHYSDPAHAAAALNYDRAYAAYCRGGGAGGGTAPMMGGQNRALAFGNAMVGILGMMAAASQPSGPLPMSLAEIQAEEARLARLRADADRELAERRRMEADRQRRCATPNPFGGAASGCDTTRENPFGRGPFWDSVARRECTTITFGPNGCMPDQTRDMLRQAGRDPQGRNPAAHRPNTASSYAPYVFTVEDFRRLGQGARFEDVLRGGMEARVLSDADERLRRVRETGR